MELERDNDQLFEQEISTFDFKAFTFKVLRIWPWILLSVAVFFAAGYFWTQTTVPLYQVSGKFFIKEKENSLELFEKPAIMDVGSIGLQNEIIILKSRPIAETTLRKLDFDVEYYREKTFVNERLYKNSPVLVQVDWSAAQIINGIISLSWDNNKTFTLSFNADSYTKYLPDGSLTSLSNIPDPGVFNFGEWIETDQFRLKISKIDTDNAGSVLFKVRDVKSLASSYSGQLEVEEAERGASIMNLSIQTPNVQLGEVYLNTLMETYLEMELQEKNEVYANTIDFIDSQVAGVASELTAFEQELENFRSTNRFYDLSTEGEAVYAQLSQLETLLKDEKFKRTYYQSLKDYLLRENYKDLVVPSGIGINDPILNALIENLLAMQVEKSRLLATQKDISPAVKEVNRKIEDANKSIREILKNVDENSNLVINDLQSRIAEIEKSFRSLPETEQNLIRIQRQFTLNENLYTFLMEKRSEAAITKASNSADNKIIEPAEGGSRVVPQPLRNYLISIFLGLFFPLAFVFIREYFRTKIEDIKYLENRLKVPVVASILLNKFDNNLVVLNHGKSGISEGFRSLRANLKFLLPNENKIVVMVTSTISGEGKTFCSMNLASVYSLTGKKTILIGCDMRKPKIFDDFKIENKKGLSTYLSGQEKDWKELINDSGFANLDLLLSGPTPPNPAELLFTPKFKELISDLKDAYDVVILDTPPVGLVSETFELFSHVDLTLFVFRQNFSKRTFVEALNSIKKSTEVKNIYGIFNGVDSRSITHGYGYTYGYGYGYYDDDKKK